MIESITPGYLSPFLSISVQEKLRLSDNRNVAITSEVPLLVIVEELDTTTTVQLSEKLYKQSSSYLKRLVIVPDAIHGNAILLIDTLEKYKQFLIEGNQTCG